MSCLDWTSFDQPSLELTLLHPWGAEAILVVDGGNKNNSTRGSHECCCANKVQQRPLWAHRPSNAEAPEVIPQGKVMSHS